MRLVRTAALCLIALLLFGHLALQYGKPHITLRAHEKAYLSAAQRCHEARSNHFEVRELVEGRQDRTASMLRKAAAVGLIDCYEREDLRLAMLAGGVDPHSIARLDLRARRNGQTNLTYFTTELAKGR